MRRIILGLLFISLLSSCVSYKEIEYRSIEGVGIEKLDGENVHIAINVKVFNPNSYTIKVKDADLKAAFNGKDLGEVKLMNTIKLDANSETVQKVVCQVSGKKILSLVPMALLSGRSKLTLKGDLKAKVFLFSKKFPVDITENIDLSEINTGF
jgi:LEA14-like dessication related protein